MNNKQIALSLVEGGRPYPFGKYPYKIVNFGGAGFAVKDGEYFYSAYPSGTSHWTVKEDNAAVFDSEEQAMEATMNEPSAEDEMSAW